MNHGLQDLPEAQSVGTGMHRRDRPDGTNHGDKPAALQIAIAREDLEGLVGLSSALADAQVQRER